MKNIKRKKQEIHRKPRNQIYRKLKKHAPKAFQKSKKIFTIKYPKLILFCLSILIAYYLFSNPLIQNIISKIGALNYLGSFISGILISFGFSAPFAVGYFITSHTENIFLLAIAGGLGATIGDQFIFKIIKFSFMNEFARIKKINLMKKIRKIVYNNKSLLVKHYLIYTFAGILIATPLPDEIGVSMLAGLTTINAKKLAILSFILHTIFIFLMLYLGKAIL